MAYMFSSVVRGATVARRAFAGHRGGRSMTTISVPGTTVLCRRPTPAVRSAGRERVDPAVPERRVGTRSSGAPRAAVLPRRRRTSRSLTGARALPPFVEEIPAFLVNPSPGLVPAAAANTVVFTGGIKVLLKGLTWPGVINSWFLGTVRASPFRLPSLPRFPPSIVERAIPRGFSSARAERDDEPGQQILPTGAATRRRTTPPGGPQME